VSVIRQEIVALPDSPILEIFREGVGRPGLIPLWAGESDVPTPGFICEAASRALAEGRTFYSHNRGTPALRAALAEYHRRIQGASIADGRIAFTYSGMNAVMQVAQAVVTSGDNAVVITPSWPNVMRALQIAGASVTEVPLHIGNAGWWLDLDAVFDACTAATRLIYIASPGNPTGWQVPEEQARALLDFARRRGIAMLSDEVYHRIVYDRPSAFSFLQIAEPGDPVFVVNSFSKAWAMTGWRLGWLVFPEGCTDSFEKLIQFNTSGGLEFMQAGAIAALEQGEEFVRFIVERCRAGRALVGERLGAMDRIAPVESQGAFYAMFRIEGMTDPMRFCRQAVHDAGLGMAPGTSFGAGAESLVRICYAKDSGLLGEAMDRLSKFVAGYRE
jgi:aspartate/methionine/tyrosine aminotransferase